MPLKSLDKYIKAKIQGYKPPYEKELWSRIEERLPVSRVPNGRGSWMLPVAAAVSLAVMAPFVIKFYNITGRNLEITAKNSSAEQRIALKNTTERAAAALAALPGRQSNPLPAVNSLPGHNSSHTQRYNPTETAKWGSQNNIDKSKTRSVVIASDERISGRALMEYIMPHSSLIETNANEDFPKKNLNRYPDRENLRPINRARWENWQSIYYPFWDNPAFTGSDGKVNVTGDVETDKVSQPGSSPSQHTYTNLGAEYKNSALGFGIGIFRSSELSPYYLQSTYGLALSKTVLHIGSTSVNIGISGASINNYVFINELNYAAQLNPKFDYVNAASKSNIAGDNQAYGVNGGLWINNKHTMAGLDVSNINQPRQGFGSDAIIIPRLYRVMFGYRFAVSSDFQLMPMAIMTRESQVDQANAMLTAVFKDRYMLSVAYQDVNSTTGLGGAYVYGGIDIKKRIRVFASYGKDIQLPQTDKNENFAHFGVRYIILR